MASKKNKNATPERGAGGEIHQEARKNGLGATQLTTNQGIPVLDNQNQLKAGGRAV